MFNSQASVGNQTSSLIPNGTLAKVSLHCRGIKQSKNTQGEYLDLELTVVEGEFARRKVWEICMNPLDPRNSEGAKSMGLMVMTRIFEAAGVFKVGDEASYGKFNSPETTLVDLAEAMEGAIVGVKLKVEKGTDGHADKNKVGEWLTPNPNSGSAFTNWTKLQQGAGNPPTRATAFGAQMAAPATASSTPPWLGGGNK